MKIGKLYHNKKTNIMAYLKDYDNIHNIVVLATSYSEFSISYEDFSAHWEESDPFFKSPTVGEYRSTNYGCDHDFIETNDGKREGYTWCRKCGWKKYKNDPVPEPHPIEKLPEGRKDKEDIDDWWSTLV